MATKIVGYQEVQVATVDIQKFCDQVRCQVEARTKTKYVHFRAVEYRTEIVEGTNYLIKVHVRDAHYIHVKVFHHLPCSGGTLVLHGVQENLQKDSPLIPF